MEQFKAVVDNKVPIWINDPKMNEYLRPSTLFSKKHFDEYLNAKPISGLSEADEQRRKASNDKMDEMIKAQEERYLATKSEKELEELNRE